MAIVTLIRCDRCKTDTDTEHLGPFDIDPDLGPRMLDLCATCRDELITPGLVALIEEYGARLHGQDAPPPKPRKEGVACPICEVVLVGRGAVITHLTGRPHGMTRAEASQVLPPPGPTEVCGECGQVCAAGRGIVNHRRTAHGIDA